MRGTGGAYVLRVWSTFAQEACRLGLERYWKLQRVREASEEFLRLMTIEACSREGYALRNMVSNWNGSVLSDVMRQYQASPEWASYERSLLRVAKVQSKAQEVRQPEKLKNTSQDTAERRRAAIDSYIEEVLDKTGKRINRTDIWRKLGYKSRSPLEAWERCDPKRPNKSADERITRLLKEKPHLK
jgi:hypothetical protein